MTAHTLEDKLRAQWCALPRAARWKLAVGVAAVMSSLMAQLFLVWLHGFMNGPKQPMLFPFLSGWAEELWRNIVHLTLDRARYLWVLDALALHILAWSLWTAWVLWRATRRPNIEYSMSSDDASTGDAR